MKIIIFIWYRVSYVRFYFILINLNLKIKNILERATESRTIVGFVSDTLITNSLKALGSLSNDILNQNEYIQTIFPVALGKTFEKVYLHLNPRSKLFKKVSQYQAQVNIRVKDIQSQILKKLTATISNNRDFVVDTLEENRDYVLGLIKDRFLNYQEIQDFKYNAKQSYSNAVYDLDKKSKVVAQKLKNIIDTYSSVETELANFLTKLYAKPHVQERVNGEVNKFLFEGSLLRNNVITNLNDIVATFYRAILSRVNTTYEIVNLRVLQNYYWKSCNLFSIYKRKFYWCYFLYLFFIYLSLQKENKTNFYSINI